MARKGRDIKATPLIDSPRYFEAKYVLLLLLVGESRAVTSLYLSPIFGTLNVHTPLVFLFEVITCTIILLLWSLSKYGAESAHSHGILSINIPPLLGSLQVIYISQMVRYSSDLGPLYGPLAAQLVPCNILTSLVVLQPLNQKSIADVRRQEKGSIVSLNSVFIACMARAFVLLVESLTQWLFENLHAGLLLGGPSSLLSIVSLLFVTTSTKRSFLAITVASCAISLVITSSTWNMAGVNGVIEDAGFKILDRQHSVTGYISVLENTKVGYQALRCDHSLLGGEWMRYPKHLQLRLREPVYAVFVTLEAVRLVDDGRSLPDTLPADEQALMIGLGVGTSATAFIYHSISTTIVEIDPVVHDFATRYFALPANHTKVIGDALTFVHDHQQSQREKYDYIIHDVFTGGAEPLELFTSDFISKLANLLRPDGTIAINYAGDLLQPSAAAVVMTALSIFPSCRLFREMAPQSAPSDQDMANMVIFCRKNAGSFEFRQPTEADYLGSQARLEHLMPQFEVDSSRFAKGTIINSSTIGKLKTSQRVNARTHWYFMRDSIPAKAWENY